MNNAIIVVKRTTQGWMVKYDIDAVEYHPTFRAASEAAKEYQAEIIRNIAECEYDMAQERAIERFYEEG